MTLDLKAWILKEAGEEAVETTLAFSKHVCFLAPHPEPSLGNSIVVMISKSLVLKVSSLKKENNHLEGILLQPGVLLTSRLLLIPQHFSRTDTEEFLIGISQGTR